MNAYLKIPTVTAKSTCKELVQAVMSQAKYIGIHVESADYSDSKSDTIKLTRTVEALEPKPSFFVYHSDKHTCSGIHRYGSEHLIYPHATNIIIPPYDIHADSEGPGGEFVKMVLRLVTLNDTALCESVLDRPSDLISAVAINSPDPYANYEEGIDESNAALIETYLECGATLLVDATKTFSRRYDCAFEIDHFCKTDNPLIPYAYAGKVNENVAIIAAIWHVLRDSLSSSWAIEALDLYRDEWTAKSNKDIYKTQIHYLKLNSSLWLDSSEFEMFFQKAKWVLATYLSVFHMAEYLDKQVVSQYDSSRVLYEQGKKIQDVMTLANHAVTRKSDSSRRERVHDGIKSEWERRCEEAGMNEMMDAFRQGVPAEDIALN